MFEKKHVAILTGISGIASLIAGIGLAVAWSYWSDTLDACPESSCSCIFYAHLRGLTFSGGYPIWCRVLTYFTLVASIFSFVIAGYYFMKLRSEPKDYTNRSSSPTTNAHINNRVRSRFSPQFKLLCGVFTVLAFIHACALSEGYLSTCREYKPVVSRHLKASGDLSDLVMERLSCGTMYDFLDYLHPDSNYHVPHIPQYQHYRRTFHINTGFILLASILLLWANVIIWCLMTIIMVFRA